MNKKKYTRGTKSTSGKYFVLKLVNYYSRSKWMFCDDDDEMATVYDYIIDAKVFFLTIEPRYIHEWKWFLCYFVLQVRVCILIIFKRLQIEIESQVHFGLAVWLRLQEMMFVSICHLNIKWFWVCIRNNADDTVRYKILHLRRKKNSCVSCWR